MFFHASAVNGATPVQSWYISPQQTELNLNFGSEGYHLPTITDQLNVYISSTGETLTASMGCAIKAFVSNQA